MNRVFDYLDELFPNPKCELNYNKDYELLIATMLSAQTTDKRVNKVTSKLFTQYPDVKALKEADVRDLEVLLRELGSFRKKSLYVKEIASSLYNNNFTVIPNNREYLESLPGVGRKTTNVFLSEIYNEPVLAVDTHVERVCKRLKIAKKNDSVLEVEKKLFKKVPKDKCNKIHHQLVLFGRYHCKAIKSNCNNCKIKDLCINKKSS